MFFFRFPGKVANLHFIYNNCLELLVLNDFVSGFGKYQIKIIKRSFIVETLDFM